MQYILTQAEYDELRRAQGVLTTAKNAELQKLCTDAAILAGLRLLAAQRADFLPRLEREARAAVATAIDASAARHLREMGLSS